MSEEQEKKERIDIIEDMLLKLHHGAAPESIQDEFNKHFTGVSAIEISMMEHQLINNPDNDITFEDVLKLCNVHANLFKNTVLEGDTPDIEQEGHPVRVFKDENHALRAALLRIHNLHKVYAELPPEEIEPGMIRGLRHQYELLGQFDRHYERKEKVLFPIMEKYGHDAPPKVMWAKDDEIRDLFKAAKQAMLQFPNVDYQEITDSFAAFEYEFNEMIFKEEAILINILLEAFDVEDWYQIAQESDPYGYAIITPTEKWEPKIEVVEEDVVAENVYQALPIQTSTSHIETQRIAVDGGIITISFEAKASERLVDPTTISREDEIQMGDGFLSINQMALLLDYLPMEITVVNADDIVQYTNFNTSWESTYYMRDFNTLGRSMESIYDREILIQVQEMVERFKGVAAAESLRHSTFELTFVPLYTPSNKYLGYIELSHNLEPYLERDAAVKRALTDVAFFKDKQIKLADLSYATDASSINGHSLETQQLNFSQGDLMLTWDKTSRDEVSVANLDRTKMIGFRNGDLSLEQVTAIFNNVPFEISYVDGNQIFQYYNSIVDYGEMIFIRTPAQVKRTMELCHPPYLWPMVKSLVDSFRNKERHYQIMWFPRGDGKIVYTMYQAMYDLTGEFHGVLETVLDIKPYVE